MNDMQQLEAAYKRVTRELARAHIVAGALQPGDEDEADDDGIDEAVSDAHVRAVTCHSTCTWRIL